MRRILGAVGLVALAAGGCGGDDADGYTEKMAVEHATDAPEPSPATVPEPARPVEAVDVRYAVVDGENVTGYLARPADRAADAAAPPGVVVIHEWWGLNDNVRAMTRRLAGEGYAALAVDLYRGRVATEPADAERLMGEAMQDVARARDNLRQAYEYLADDLGAPRVGSVGWCFGGGWSLDMARTLPGKLDAAVIFYGRLTVDPDELRPIDTPILGLFGEADTGIPPDTVRAFEKALRDLGKDAEIRIYPGAGHAFANPSGRRYDPAAAADAWGRTLAFFHRTLQAGPARRP